MSLHSTEQSNPDAILGKWMTIEGNLEVEVYKQNNDFKAKVIWFKDTDDKSRPMNERRDEKNPDKTLRSRKWIGMEVLRNLRWSSQAWMTKDHQLKVKGYWLFKFISQTKVFKRM